jgi:HD-like signal output (HDOD) protein
MMTSESSETTKNNLLRLARKLPTSSMVFSRLGLLLRDINTELGDIVKLVSVDSGLSSRVIRVSNSVMFGGDEAARTLEEAINRIGFRETHRVVGMAMTEQVFQNDLPIYGVTAEQLWENSVVTALAMEKLALLTGEDEGMAYTVGLLRTVGKLVMDRLLEIEQPGLTCPEGENFDLIKWEKAWAPMSSNEVGAMILDDWKLPAVAGVSVRQHYNPLDSNESIAPLLYLASWVAKENKFGLRVESRIWQNVDAVAAFASVSQDQLKSIVEETEAAFDEVAKSLKAK